MEVFFITWSLWVVFVILFIFPINIPRKPKSKKKIKILTNSIFQLSGFWVRRTINNTEKYYLVHFYPVYLPGSKS